MAISRMVCPAPVLNGSFSALPSGTTIDLTAQGPVDWIHWGRFTEFSHDRKAVVSAISDFSTLEFGLPRRRENLSTRFSWYDGLQNSLVTNTTTGIFIASDNQSTEGFTFTAPADLTNRILRVYAGTSRGSGRLTAVLSDSSAPDFTHLISNSAEGVYVLNYAAASQNQAIHVKWEGPANNSIVFLQAAALALAAENNPPSVTLVTPALNATWPATSTQTLQAIASDSDGSVALVEFFSETNKIGEAAQSPYTMTWTNPPIGRHVLTARATDNAGASRSSKPVEVFVHGDGGSLEGEHAFPPSFVLLSDEGTNDWAHWGLNSPGSFNHKSGVPSQISHLTPLGTNSMLRYADNCSRFSWTGGTPVEDAFESPTGVFIFGLDKGFELTLPAGRQPRTVRLYAGLYGARANFQAWLSDASAPAYSDTSLDNHYNNDYRVYTLRYRAASDGQTLTVRHTALNTHDALYGNVTFQAATLCLGPAPLAPFIFITNVTVTPGEFRFSFATDPGSDYQVEYTHSLPPPEWLPLTNIPGDGAMQTVCDPRPGPATGRFYRVRRQ